MWPVHRASLQLGLSEPPTSPPEAGRVNLSDPPKSPPEFARRELCLSEPPASPPEGIKLHEHAVERRRGEPLARDAQSNMPSSYLQDRKQSLVEPPSAPPEESAAHRATCVSPRCCRSVRGLRSEPDHAPPEEDVLARCMRVESENKQLKSMVEELSRAVQQYAEKQRELERTMNGRSECELSRRAEQKERAVARNSRSGPANPDRHRKNEGVIGCSDFKEPPTSSSRSGTLAHMIIAAIDYKYPGSQMRLTSTIDGKNMEKFADACGIQDVHTLYNEECTFQNVVKKVMDVGYTCSPDDYFIFYFAGHGTSVKDGNQDEEDGFDEAFCFLTPRGTVTAQSCMIDDIFADVILRSVPEQARVLILTDCCHSGSIADLTRPAWDGRKAISISGCLDSEQSSDMGRGGVFTQSMLLAIDRLTGDGPAQFSVGKLFNAILREDERTFKASQTISIHYSKGIAPQAMAWPLIPLPASRYEAPLRKAARTGALQHAHLTAREGSIPEELAQWARENGIDLDEDYSDDELEQGWRPYKERLDKLNLAMQGGQSSLAQYETY